MRALAEPRLQMLWGALTVGQSVLQRVDAVEDNDTCRSDWLAREFPGWRFNRRTKIQVDIQFDSESSGQKEIVEYAYQQRRRGSWGQLLIQCVSQSNPCAAPRRQALEDVLRFHSDIPRRPGNFFPRRDMVIE